MGSLLLLTAYIHEKIPRHCNRAGEFFNSS